MVVKNGDRLTQIGIDRILRLSWLEKTAYLVLAGNDSTAIRTYLKEEIASSFRSANTEVRGALDKTLTNLIKIWVRPPKDLSHLHKEGLQFMTKLAPEQRIPVHWGMTMAVYPFWANVASHVGRILKLQEAFQLRSIQRRLREQYGQRETVSRAAQRVVRSFVDWGVLQDGNQNGIYKKGKSIEIEKNSLITWLVEAYIYSHPNYPIPLKEIIGANCFFPFQIKFISPQDLLSTSKRLEVVRHGLDQDLVLLKKIDI